MNNIAHRLSTLADLGIIESVTSHDADLFGMPAIYTVKVNADCTQRFTAPEAEAFLLGVRAQSKNVLRQMGRTPELSPEHSARWPR